MNNLCIASKIEMTYPFTEPVCRNLPSQSSVTMSEVPSSSTPSNQLFLEGAHPRDLFPIFPRARFPSAGIFDYFPGVGCSSTAGFTRSNACTGEPPELLKDEVRIANHQIILPVNAYFPQQGRVYALCEQSPCRNLTSGAMHMVFSEDVLLPGSDAGIRGELRVSVPPLQGLFYCCYVDAMLHCPQDQERVNNATSVYDFVRAQGAWLETNLVEVQIP